MYLRRAGEQLRVFGPGDSVARESNRGSDRGSARLWYRSSPLTLRWAGDSRPERKRPCPRSTSGAPGVPADGADPDRPGDAGSDHPDLSAGVRAELHDGHGRPRRGRVGRRVGRPPGGRRRREAWPGDPARRSDRDLRRRSGAARSIDARLRLGRVPGQRGGRCRGSAGGGADADHRNGLADPARPGDVDGRWVDAHRNVRRTIDRRAGRRPVRVRPGLPRLRADDDHRFDSLHGDPSQDGGWTAIRTADGATRQPQCGAPSSSRAAAAGRHRYGAGDDGAGRPQRRRALDRRRPRVSAPPRSERSSRSAPAPTCSWSRSPAT